MKIEFTKEGFLKAASLVAQVISPRPSLPVLSNVRLTAALGTLEIVATNLETTIIYKIPVKVSETGVVTAPGRILIDFCQAAPGEKVSLVAEKERLLVKTEKAEATLAMISADEFPPIESAPEGESFAIDRKKLLESLLQVVPSAAPEEGRPVLTGLLLTASRAGTVLVATDGYRLTKKELKIKNSLEVIIPARALREAAKALAEQEDEQVKLVCSKEKNQIVLQTKNLKLITRLIEGVYPDYEQIIPREYCCEVTVGTKALSEALKLTALFARDVGNVIRFDINDKGLSLDASTAQVGEAKSAVPAKPTGENLKIAFNSRFLLEALSTIRAKETIITFSGPTSAAVLRGKDDPGLEHIIMPVRTQG